MRWPKYWSFSFSISPSNEYPELISFRIAWFDLLTVQRTLKSLLKHHSSKASRSNPPPKLCLGLPAQGDLGMLACPGKASDSSQPDTAPCLPGSHSGSQRAFSPAGTPTEKASGLCPPAPALLTLITHNPSLGRHPKPLGSQRDQRPRSPQIPAVCVACGRTQNSQCSLPSLGSRRFSQGLVPRAHMMSCSPTPRLLARCSAHILSSQAQAGSMSTEALTHSVAVDKACGLSEPQFPEVHR